MNEYPKMLYQGDWANLGNNCIVYDRTEEDAARKRGYRTLDETNQTTPAAAVQKPATAKTTTAKKSTVATKKSTVTTKKPTKSSG